MGAEILNPEYLNPQKPSLMASGVMASGDPDEFDLLHPRKKAI